MNKKQVIWFNTGWPENSRGQRLLEWLNANGFEEYDDQTQTTHRFFERPMQKDENELLPEGITLQQIMRSVIEWF